MEKNKDENRVPVVGDKIYVPTSLYLGHGVDDVIGGIATVVKAYEEYGSYWVEVKEHPDNHYNWDFLEKDQEKLKKEFGEKRAYPDPDYSPSSNAGW